MNTPALAPLVILLALSSSACSDDEVGEPECEVAIVGGGVGGLHTEHCLNFIEIPQEPYAAAANVTRSVYDDDIDCEQYWADLSAQGDDAVDAAIHEGLTHLFDGNGVSEPASLTVPDPLSTTIQVWPDAWHWLGAGTPVSNAELFDWALDPLGEDVALVGEAYNVQRSTWSDAAYKSSIHLLNERYGMSLAGL